MATRALGLVSTLILVRILTPEDFGLVALGATFATVIDALSWFGIEDAILREKTFSREVYDTGFTMAIIRAIVMGLLISSLAVPAGYFFHDHRLALIILALAAATLIEGFRNIGVVEFRRTFQFEKEFVLWIVPRIAGVVLAIGFAFALRTYWALVIAILTQRILRVVFSYRMHPYRPRLSLSAWRRLTSYSVWNWALSIVAQIRDQSASIFIGRLLGPAQVGVFSVAFELATIPMTELIEPLGRAAFSGFNAARHAGLSAGQMYLRMVAAMGLVAIPASIGLSLVADPLVKLAFGPAWGGATPVMQLISIAYGLNLLASMSSTLFLAHGLMSLSFRVVTATAVLRVVLLLILIPALGLTGAALAVTAAVMLQQVLYVALTIRHFDVRLRDLVNRFWRTLLASTAMAMALTWNGLGWHVTAAVTKAGLAMELFVGVTGGIAAYAATLLTLWLAAGRPAGAEADMLMVMQRLCVGLSALGQRQWHSLRKVFGGKSNV
jgi:O-antigen/teichoic acid export membrane protein